MIFRSIGRVFRSVTGGLGGALKGVAGNLLKGGLGGILKGGLGGILGKVMNKLPFGNILSKVTSFLGKAGPLASLAKGPLGMIGGLLGNLAGQGGGLGKIAQFAQSLLGRLGGAQNLPLPGLNNLTELFAKGQAQNLLGSLLR
jgi:hypothetical protein